MKPNFSVAATVVMDFNRQRRKEHSPKDILRSIRDNKVEKVGDTVIVSDDELISAQNWTWGSFLANRENKARLVLLFVPEVGIFE